ncbi:DinB family protein [Parafrankia discariae]|uniref:DinB family protein n=1 Tax=Parafrankia discariae TaxID=365528 RepID=UPI0003603A2F|nr:DinB family protein [Parafrankia discariae]
MSSTVDVESGPETGTATGTVTETEVDLGTDPDTVDEAGGGAAEGGTVGEKEDLLTTLAKHRDFLRYTVRDLTDEQAARRTTVSALCLGGLIKHVTAAERSWTDFIVSGVQSGDPENWMKQHQMLMGDTLTGLLADYEATAERTREVVESLPDLGLTRPLPEAPWFEPGASWSMRRVLLHIIAETSQHAGHADIIRESLDGSRTMG